MRAIRRIGKTPAERGDTTGVSGSPDLLELDDGSYAIIGLDITDELGRQPFVDATCADDERIVKVPRHVLIAAKVELPDD